MELITTTKVSTFPIGGHCDILFDLTAHEPREHPTDLQEYLF